MVKLLTDMNFNNGSGVKFLMPECLNTTPSFYFINDANRDGYEDVAAKPCNYLPGTRQLDNIYTIIYGGKNIYGNFSVNSTNAQKLNLQDFQGRQIIQLEPQIIPVKGLTQYEYTDYVLFNGSNIYNSGGNSSWFSEIFVLPSSPNGLNLTNAISIGNISCPTISIDYGDVVAGNTTDLIITCSYSYYWPNNTASVFIIAGGSYLLSGNFQLSNITDIIANGGSVLQFDPIGNNAQINIYTTILPVFNGEEKQSIFISFGEIGFTRDIQYQKIGSVLFKGNQTFNDVVKLNELDYDFSLYSSQISSTVSTLYPGEWFFGSPSCRVLQTTNYSGIITGTTYAPYQATQTNRLNSSPYCFMDWEKIKAQPFIDPAEFNFCSSGTILQWYSTQPILKGFLNTRAATFYFGIYPKLTTIFFPLPDNLTLNASEILDSINKFGFYTFELTNYNRGYMGSFNGDPNNLLINSNIYFGAEDNLVDTGNQICLNGGFSFCPTPTASPSVSVAPSTSRTPSITTSASHTASPTFSTSSTSEADSYDVLTGTTILLISAAIIGAIWDTDI